MSDDEEEKHCTLLCSVFEPEMIKREGGVNLHKSHPETSITDVKEEVMEPQALNELITNCKDFADITLLCETEDVTGNGTDNDDNKKAVDLEMIRRQASSCRVMQRLSTDTAFDSTTGKGVPVTKRPRIKVKIYEESLCATDTDPMQFDDRYDKIIDKDDQQQTIKIKKNPSKKIILANKSMDELMSRPSYICDHCQQNFVTKLKLEQHIKFINTVKSTIDFVCKTCDYKCTTFKALRMHAKLHDKNRPYKCDSCSYCFKTISHLKQHLRKHTKEKLYKCKMCDYGTDRKEQYQRHEKNHLGINDNRFQCDECQTKFRSPFALKTHMLIHTGKKPYKCKICNYAGISKASLFKHMSVHGDRPHVCNVCKLSFKRLTHLRDHEMILHTEEKPYKCDNCDYSCKIKDYLRHHIKKHTGVKLLKCSMCDYATAHNHRLKAHILRHESVAPYKCEMCDFVTHLRGSLKQHFKTHFEERPYKCDFCDSAFKGNSDLKVHIRTHTGERPYKCVMCDYAATSSSALSCHMRSHTNQKPYKCEKCDSIFKSRRGFKLHTLKHTGVKPHKCEYCEFASYQLSDLKSHLRRHTGEKPYKCEMCDYASTTNKDLKTHLSKHSTEKKYKCKMCDRKYKCSSSLTLHKTSHENKS